MMSSFLWQPIRRPTAKSETADSHYLELAVQLEALCEEVPQKIKADDTIRVRIIEAAKRLIPELEKPEDTAQRVIYTVCTLDFGKTRAGSTDKESSLVSFWGLR